MNTSNKLKVNDENIKFSICIPVYNTEKYLDKCLSSVINQAYSNFEVILVDDGSTDDCSRMCDDWSQKDFRFRTIHKNNEGLMAARRLLLREAQGDYILFVDSDDWVAEDWLISIKQAIDKYNADIICFNWYWAYCEEAKYEVYDSFMELDYLYTGYGKNCYIQIFWRVCITLYGLGPIAENSFPMIHTLINMIRLGWERM